MPSYSIGKLEIYLLTTLLAILYYPGVCCPSISQSLLSCISATGDYQLQQLGWQLHLGDAS